MIIHFISTLVIIVVILFTYILLRYNVYKTVFETPYNVSYSLIQTIIYNIVVSSLWWCHQCIWTYIEIREFVANGFYIGDVTYLIEYIIYVQLCHVKLHNWILKFSLFIYYQWYPFAHRLNPTIWLMSPTNRFFLAMMINYLNYYHYDMYI